MTHRAKPRRLMVEQLEDRLTPSGSQIPAGEFNWTQYSPTGTLTQLIWDGDTLVYRMQTGSGWQSEKVASSTDFTQPQYGSVAQMENASRTAQLVYTSDGTPHVLFLEDQYNWQTNTYQTQIQHYARINGRWHFIETITPSLQSTWGPNNLVAEAGANNSIHLIFTETNVAATGVGQFGSGTLWYATNKTGSWTFDKIADTADLEYDVWFLGGRWAPRFLSLAVDSQNNAYVTYTPEFYISGAFGTVNSSLMYANNASGSWQSELVQGAIDGTADAGLGASVAVAPDGTIAVASYYVDRYVSGSPQASWLMYHVRTGSGWTTSTVVSSPDGYVATDGPYFTGFAPQLTFDSLSNPTITFSDEAGQHLPISYANEVAGQIRSATWNGGSWDVTTIFHQTDPLVNQLLYPVAATFDGQTAYAGVVAVSTLDSNLNPTQVDFSLMEMSGPTTTTIVSPPVVSPPTVSPPVVPPVVAPIVPPTVPPPPAVVITPAHVSGTEAGVTTLVRVDYSDGTALAWTPFGTGFTGGAAVARGDVNRDGIDDIIVASGIGAAGRVKVYDGATRHVIGSYVPFGGYEGGLSLAVGDLNGDGVADIAVGSDSEVAILNGATGQVIREFAPYGAGYTGGVRLAIGDVNHDGLPDLVVAPGDGTRWIRIYNGATIDQSKGQLQLLGGITAFAPQCTGPENIAVGDVTGDGFADIVVGTGTGSPKFQVYSGAAIGAGLDPDPLFTQLAWANNGRGIRLAFVDDTDQDNSPDLVVTSVGTDQAAEFPSTQLTVTGWPASAAEAIDPMPGIPSGVYVG
jgi:FG-GAP-like repeat